MSYIKKKDLVDRNFMLNQGEDFLKATVLNRPHSALAANMDQLVPLIENLRDKIGDNYTVGRIDGASPFYNSTNYINHGQTYREAIITLDRAANDLYNFILSLLKQPTEQSPFNTLDGIVHLSPGNTDENSIVNTDVGSESESNKNLPPIKRSFITPPKVFYAGYKGPKHLIAFDVRVYNKLASLYESIDGGENWNQIPGSEYYLEQWNFLKEWCGAYKRDDGNMDIAYGTIEQNKWDPYPIPNQPGIKASGYATYDSSTDQWTFIRNEYNTYVSYMGLDIKRSAASDYYKCIITYMNRTYTRFRVLALAENFSEIRGQNRGDDTIYLVNPFTKELDWVETRGISSVVMSNGKVVVVVSGKTASWAHFQLYVCYSNDGGNTFSIPEKLDVENDKDYVAPYITQLANGRVVITFSTNEGGEIAPMQVKLVQSTTGNADSFGSKSTIYNALDDTANLVRHPTSKLIQLGNGDMYTFIETPLVTDNFADRQLIRVRMKIEV